MNDVLLQTKGLRKRYGGVNAIDGVDFKLERGELRCLIGPNGAGKSTFFKMLTAQIPSTEGAITFESRDITHAQSHEVSRLGIGIKNQVPDVFNGLTVRENLWLAACFRHEKDRSAQIVDDVLDRLTLSNLTDALVGELAHGQRQWVEFGMAMALQPRLILLDEPTAGMSTDETSRTAELIQELNKSTAIIVVEHDMQFIQKIATKVTVFHQGAVLVEDTMESIQANEVVRDIYLGKRQDA